MDKCRWEDGEFMPCSKLNEHSISIDECSVFLGELHRKIIHCCYCGVDVCKPETIIKGSGGTWVAWHDGVDYIWDSFQPMAGAEESHDFKSAFTRWAPIKEVTITDETALLRPLVWVEGDSETDTLYGLNDTEAILWNTGKIFTKFIRLAKVSDLEEPNA